MSGHIDIVRAFIAAWERRDVNAIAAAAVWRDYFDLAGFQKQMA